MRTELKLYGGLVVLAFIGTFVLMSILTPSPSKFPARFSITEKDFALRNNDFSNRPWLSIDAYGRKSMWI